MAINLDTLVIETIPLPLAGILFSDSIHAAVLRRHQIDAGVVLFEREPNEYYINSIQGFNNPTTTKEDIFSDFCAEISNQLISNQNDRAPFNIIIPDIPELDSYIQQEGFESARIFKIYDYLNTSGFWLMFFRNGNSPVIGRKDLGVSLNSMQLIDAVRETINQQSSAASIDEIINNWVKVLDYRDKETEGHTIRVAGMAVELARKYGLDERLLESVRRGALLHDIGKLVIPNSILHKPGALTEEEWEMMRVHPRIVRVLLSNLNLPEDVLDIPTYHHERWDGSGYPYGLIGDEIPLAARIFAVVDVWDALNSDRSYRRRLSSLGAKVYIVQKSGKEFDPDVVNCFFDL